MELQQEVKNMREVYQHLLGSGFRHEGAPFGGIELGFVAGARCRVNDLYTRFMGRWARVYVEDDVRGGFFWYLSDHDDVAGALQRTGCEVVLPSEDDASIRYESHVVPNDRARVPSYQGALRGAQAALRHLERLATLAWVTGKLALKWPDSMEPSRPATMQALEPGYAAVFAGIWAEMYRRGWRPATTGPRCR